MIPDHVMRELRYIEVYTAKRIRNLLLGAFRSPLRGPGFDFDQHQPYRPGDDVRRIDWNVTARMNAPFVRHTHAERELTVMIALDVSHSMAVGTSRYSKKDLAMLITGSLLFSTLADQINTGFLAFADRVLAFSPPHRARASAWTVLEQLWALSPRTSETRLLPVIDFLSQRLTRMSVVFLVSDFVTEEAIFAGSALPVLAARHDVIAVVPRDSSDESLPEGLGYLRLRDAETGRPVDVALGPRTRARFTEDARARRAALSDAFYRVPMDHVFVQTDQSPTGPLLALFERRARA
jgi:uncharacterized protein (DUF58 family)